MITIVQKNANLILMVEASTLPVHGFPVRIRLRALFGGQGLLSGCRGPMYLSLWMDLWMDGWMVDE